MDFDLIKLSSQFKALSDPNRLLILEMLTCGEMCGCELLEKLHITQPTLSYHMNILREVDLIVARRSGKNIFYKINIEVYKNIQSFFQLDVKTNCICE